MDNNTFEKTMIKAVNDKAHAAEASAKFAEDAKRWAKKRKAQRIRAITEMVVWVLGVAVVCVASWCEGWHDAIPTIVGLVAGIRVGGLIRTI